MKIETIKILKIEKRHRRQTGEWNVKAIINGKCLKTILLNCWYAPTEDQIRSGYEHNPACWTPARP